MRILVFSQFYWPEPFRVHEICEELVKRGNTVTVVTTFPNYPDGEVYEGYKKEDFRLEDINGVRVYRYKTHPRKNGLKNLALSYITYVTNVSLKLRTLRKENYDIIYVYQLSPVCMAIPAILYKKLTKLPLFIYCLDIWPESIKEFIPNEDSTIFRFIKYFSKKIYQSADTIAVTSNSFKEYLIGVCDVKEEIIHYLPQHSDDIGVCPKVLKTDTVDFYFTGNIGEAQNVDLIIDAVNIIKDTKGFTVNFVGSGSKLEYAIEKVNRLELNNIIFFHGRHPASKMPDFFKKADACILTLKNTDRTGMTIPGKLQTYMAAGKPVIAAIDGDARDIIEIADCGHVVDSNDMEGFASIIYNYLQKTRDVRPFNINSRNYFTENFTLKKHIDKLVKLLNVLLDK